MPEPFTWRISAIIFRFAALRAVLKRVCGLFGRLMFDRSMGSGSITGPWDAARSGLFVYLLESAEPSLRKKREMGLD